MFGKSIKSYVMSAVNEMIDTVQAKYDAQVEAIEREAGAKKIQAKEEAVESIIGKFR